ncbi:MAG: ABC transporter substrate-binding protein [Candidatus Bathyarchaeia archaeon]
MKNKKGIMLVMALVALTSLILMPGVYATNPPPNPYELIVDRLSGYLVATLDSHNSYDGPSGELIQNVYDPLIYWEGEPYDVFVPKLATQVWIAPPDPTAPPYTNFTIYFKIRENVLFHNKCRTDYPMDWSNLAPIYLTPEDVEYSFERLLVHDYANGAQWMVFEAVLGVEQADTSWPSNESNPINLAFESNATHFWMNIANRGFAPSQGTTSFTPIQLFDQTGRQRATFWQELSNAKLCYPIAITLQVIGEPWFLIVSKRWTLEWLIPTGTAQGLDLNETAPGTQIDWPGTWDNWIDYEGWAESPYDKIGTEKPGVVCGTGPYILDRYDPTLTGGYSLVKNDNYWGGWPASYPNPPYVPQPASGLKPAGYVTRVTVRQQTLTNLISNMIAGDCDLTFPPSPNMGQLHVGNDRNAETLPGIRLDYPCFLFSMGSLHPTFDITPTPDNRYGKINDYGVYTSDGIPRDFFNDTHIRKAFFYLVNHSVLIDEYFLGEAYQPNTIVPMGLKYQNPDQEGYKLNITRAVEEFNQANPAVRETGFTVTLIYALALEEGRVILEDLAARINQIGQDYFNGKFHATVMGISWTEFFPAWVNLWLPFWHMTWGADYADIHNFAQPFMHSRGVYPMFQGYHNDYLDSLVEAGITAPEGPERQAIYYEAQRIYFEEAIGLPLDVPVFRRYLREWVAGRYYNALYQGMVYAYNLWKWEYIRGNVNCDDKVFMDDILAIIDAFGSYYGKAGLPKFHQRWNFRCDIPGNPRETWTDRKIDMYDITAALDNFGKTQTPWQPPP